ncbi:hypothetical protein DIPPA_14927 [Diplonema papillatum]|nr:hypothetical protein DIPPA_14927 [Diplonema papillatum]
MAASETLMRIQEAEQRMKALAVEHEGEAEQKNPAWLHSRASSPLTQAHLAEKVENLEREFVKLQRMVHGLRDMVEASASQSRRPQLKTESLTVIPRALSTGSHMSPHFSPTSAELEELRNLRYIHSTFDLDNNGYLGFVDCAKFQEITDGSELTADAWADMCSHLKVNPSVGLDVSDLGRLYSDSAFGADLAKDAVAAERYVSSRQT